MYSESAALHQRQDRVDYRVSDVLHVQGRGEGFGRARIRLRRASSVAQSRAMPVSAIGHLGPSNRTLPFASIHLTVPSGRMMQWHAA
ncbi:hypothetical protein [Streptomyces laculatispora]|uniref:hypothetical protein n=1 Tax=Streptomyces laculatispora TaxID=887464 RepID=UPI001A942544|nr:hypothetical protein [Streptomyces laculatispora]MBO0913131.1 hypothetical protein [Streptomyces laculatispora]